jgi:protein-disulfide isomerase
VLGGGTIAGIGFTVSLLIATLAFHGVSLDEAKLGVLTAGVLAAALTWLELQAVRRLPRPTRLKAFLGSSQPIQDLVVALDPEHDHWRGPADAPVTLVEYGDFECPYCGQAETVIRELLSEIGDLRYVWRHLPLTDVHPQADLAAEAAEAAGAQGRFWEMHERLLSHQDELTLRELVGHAQELGLDIEQFKEFLRRRKGAAKVSGDVESADASNVSGTPTFFINGRRHYGVYDLQTLSAEVKAARARAAVEALGRPAPAPEDAGAQTAPS